jgi:hypothetical protein
VIIMKIPATWAVAIVLAATVGIHGSCLAGEKGAGTDAGNALGALAGSAVPTAELGRQHARGSTNTTRNFTTNFSFDGALSDGALTGNAANSAVSGTITNTDSITGNNGIMTVFQNTGANSLFQQSTSIVINVK